MCLPLQAYGLNYVDTHETVRTRKFEVNPLVTHLLRSKEYGFEHEVERLLDTRAAGVQLNETSFEALNLELVIDTNLTLFLPRAVNKNSTHGTKKSLSFTSI